MTDAMKEGYWLNAETMHYIELLCQGVDHEASIRTPSTHEWLGVPASIAKTFNRFTPRTDRQAFLIHVLRRLPQLLRVRGHSTHVTVEFWASDPAPRLATVRKWAEKFSTPTMPLHIVNLKTGQNWQVYSPELPKHGAKGK